MVSFQTFVTRDASFFLDDHGICFALRRHDAQGLDERQARCIGAQYVACIVDGEMRGAPCVGARLILAYVRDDGRIAVARTAQVLRIERRIAPAESTRLLVLRRYTSAEEETMELNAVPARW